jgi:hypothetical protein
MITDRCSKQNLRWPTNGGTLLFRIGFDSGEAKNPNPAAILFSPVGLATPLACAVAACHAFGQTFLCRRGNHGVAGRKNEPFKKEKGRQAIAEKTNANF